MELITGIDGFERSFWGKNKIVAEEDWTGRLEREANRSDCLSRGLGIYQDVNYDKEGDMPGVGGIWTQLLFAKLQGGLTLCYCHFVSHAFLAT